MLSFFNIERNSVIAGDVKTLEYKCTVVHYPHVFQGYSSLYQRRRDSSTLVVRMPACIIFLSCVYA